MGANTVMARLDSVEADKIEAILDAQTLPKASASDNGKVLKVAKGEWSKGSVAELPSVTEADNGKVLKVVDGAWAVASLTEETPTTGEG